MTERTAQTENERIAVAMLKRCRFAPATWDKRFVGQLAADTLTAKERPQVWRLFIRYRRQIQGMMVGSQKRAERQAQIGKFQALLHEAASMAAPDFRKQDLTAKIVEITKRKSINAEAQSIQGAEV